jgi:hypothetical protein
MTGYKFASEPFGYNENGKPICNAKTKNGKVCRNTLLQPNFRCRMHGGKTPRGLASPNIKNGLYSADMPTRLLARYDDLMADGAVLSVRSDIALLGSAIGETLAEMKQSEESVDPEALVAAVERIADNWKSWDWTKMTAEMSALLDMAKGRVARQDSMNRVRSLIKDRAALVAQENKVLLDREAMIPVDQVLLLMRALTGVVRREVRDPKTLVAIEAEFTRVATGGGR